MTMQYFKTNSYETILGWQSAVSYIIPGKNAIISQKEPIKDAIFRSESEANQYAEKYIQDKNYLKQ